MANATEYEAFVVARQFDAPRALVWKAFTEIDRLAHWWGPKGFKLTHAALDLTPGGLFHYGMEAPDGKPMWGRWVFREVEAPARLAFVSSFSNPEGEIGPCPFPMDWPPEVLTEILFTEEGGRTNLHMTGIPINATDAQFQTFEGMKPSMQMGWGGTFEQLAAYLKEASQ